MKSPMIPTPVATEATPDNGLSAARRRPYVKPAITRKRSVERTTLLSGGGVTSVGAIAVNN